MLVDNMLMFDIDEVPSHVLPYSQLLKSLKSQRNIYSIFHNIISQTEPCYIETTNKEKFYFSKSQYRSRINIIELKSRCRKNIYLLQHRTSFDGLFIPHLNCCIVGRFVTIEDVKSAFHGLENMTDIFKNNNITGSFLGFVSGTDRPSHFYSNIAPAVSDLPDNVSLYQLSQQSFTDLSKALPHKNFNSTLTDKNSLNKKSNMENGYFFLAGYNFSSDLEEPMESFKTSFNQSIDQDIDPEYINLLSNKSQKNPIIWMGVTGQKREMHNSEQLYFDCLSFIQKEYPFYTVIFDGWTPPLKRNEQDNKEIENDRIIANNITNLLVAAGHNFECFYVMGRSSETKIKLSRQCNFFVSNYSTGSIHISRFSECHGIGHLSNAHYNTFKGEFIHPNASRFPAEWTYDIAGAKTADNTSYYVDAQKFQGYFIEKFINSYVL